MKLGPTTRVSCWLRGGCGASARGTRAFIWISADDWRDLASVVVPRAALRELRTAGVDPFDLEGRMIRVRGVVQGRRLLVDHPEQIERLDG